MVLPKHHESVERPNGPNHWSPARLCVVILALLMANACISAHHANPWLAPDKVRHMSLSAAVAAGGYVLGAELTDHEALRILCGLGLGMMVGTAKESLDAAKGGAFDHGDMAANLVGSTVGILGGLLLHRLFGSQDPQDIARGIYQTTDKVTPQPSSTASPFPVRAKAGERGLNIHATY